MSVLSSYFCLLCYSALLVLVGEGVVKLFYNLQRDWFNVKNKAHCQF